VIHLNLTDVTKIKIQDAQLQEYDGRWLSKILITTHDDGEEQSVVITCKADDIKSLSPMVVENIYSTTE
jgi:hypothetical protein